MTKGSTVIEKFYSALKYNEQHKDELQAMGIDTKHEFFFPVKTPEEAGAMSQATVAILSMFNESVAIDERVMSTPVEGGYKLSMPHTFEDKEGDTFSKLSLEFWKKIFMDSAWREYNKATPPLLALRVEPGVTGDVIVGLFSQIGRVHNTLGASGKLSALHLNGNNVGFYEEPVNSILTEAAEDAKHQPSVILVNKEQFLPMREKELAGLKRLTERAGPEGEPQR